MAIGSGSNVILTVSLSVSVHGSKASAVSINSTFPEIISVDPGVYTAVRLVASSKTPSPSVLHKAVVLLVIEPDNPTVWFTQIVSSIPALAIGEEIRLNTSVSEDV